MSRDTIFKKYSTKFEEEKSLKFICPYMVICTQYYPFEHAELFGPREASLVYLVVVYVFSVCLGKFTVCLPFTVIIVYQGRFTIGFTAAFLIKKWR